LRSLVFGLAVASMVDFLANVFGNLRLVLELGENVFANGALHFRKVRFVDRGSPGAKVSLPCPESWLC
jgi:hypothetical protein